MRAFGRRLGAQPERFAAVFVVPMALVGLSLPELSNLVVLVAAVASLFLLTGAPYTRNGPS